MQLNAGKDRQAAAAQTGASDEGRRPRHVLPPGACDAHCHVFGPAARFPYAPERSYTPADAPKEALAALHARLGLSRAVIVQASCHGTDNSAMLDAIAAAPHARRGVAMVPGDVSDAALDTLHAGGVRGVRFNFVRHLGGQQDVPSMHRIIASVAPRGWHVVLHMDAPDIAALAPMMRALPLPFVIDHMGRVDAGLGPHQPALDALIELTKLERCWIKVSGAERISDPPFAAAIPIARRIMEAAPDRVLWGTDFPHPNLRIAVDEADLVDLVPAFAPDEAARRRLLVDNPARLYGF
jgi:predicted TIM-barrel fold metal-dependent hydrolase